MKWKDNPELWDEILEISRQPVEKIRHKSKYNDFFPSASRTEEAEQKYYVEFDDDTVNRILRTKGITLNQLAKHTLLSVSALYKDFRTKEMRQEIIDLINDALGRKLIIRKDKVNRNVKRGGDTTRKELVFYNVDTKRIKQLTVENAITFADISRRLNCGESKYYRMLKNQEMRPWEAQVLNELFGEEVVRELEDVE